MRRQIKPEKRLTKEETHNYVKEAINGNQRAFDRLFAKYKPIMFVIAQKRMFNASFDEIEEEVVHFLGEMFSRKLELFDEKKASFDTWITRSFYNWLASIPGRKKRIEASSLQDIYVKDTDTVVEYSIPDKGSSITSNTLNSTPSFRKMARLFLTHLTKLEASVLVMKYWYGYSDKEIEAHHQIPTGTAWYRQKRAIVKLRKKVHIDEYI